MPRSRGLGFLFGERVSRGVVVSVRRWISGEYRGLDPALSRGSPARFRSFERGISGSVIVGSGSGGWFLQNGPWMVVGLVGWSSVSMGLGFGFGEVSGGWCRYEFRDSLGVGRVDPWGCWFFVPSGCRKGFVYSVCYR